MTRDPVHTGEVTEFPYFWGPFDCFQTINTSGFDTDYWIEHSLNVYRGLSSGGVKPRLIGEAKRFFKILIGREFKRFLPGGLVQQIEGGARTLDIGGGWGDNYCSLLLAGADLGKAKYFVLDNKRQADFGKSIFKECEVNFVSEIQDNKYDIVLLIGTLQYIKNWKNIFDTLEKLSAKTIYIARTPFSGRGSFCAV